MGQLIHSLSQLLLFLHSGWTPTLIKYWWRVEEGWFHVIPSLMMINLLWGIIQIFNSCDGNEERFLSRGLWKRTIILVRCKNRSAVQLKPLNTSQVQYVAVLLPLPHTYTHTHTKSITQQSISQCCPGLPLLPLWVRPLSLSLVLPICTCQAGSCLCG